MSNLDFSEEKKTKTMIREHFIDEGHPNRPGIELHSVQAIIMHWTANTAPTASAAANRNYFNRRYSESNGKRFEYGGAPFRFGSTQFIVDDVEIVQCMPEHEVAYHVGDGTPKVKFPVRPNFCTIGIELCVNKDFPMVLRRTVWLLEQLNCRYPEAKIGRHYDVTGKLCPHMYLPSNVGGKMYDWSWDTFMELVRTRGMEVQKL
jgi:N-acetylmuramoyl-L-alanine amidase CwlA